MQSQRVLNSCTYSPSATGMVELAARGCFWLLCTFGCKTHGEVVLEGDCATTDNDSEMDSDSGVVWAKSASGTWGLGNTFGEKVYFTQDTPEEKWIPKELVAPIVPKPAHHEAHHLLGVFPHCSNGVQDPGQAGIHFVDLPVHLRSHTLVFHDRVVMHNFCGPCLCKMLLHCLSQGQRPWTTASTGSFLEQTYLSPPHVHPPRDDGSPPPRGEPLPSDAPPPPLGG